MDETHLFFVPNIKGLAQTILTWEGKFFAAADADAVETNWKHKVTPDWGDLINTLGSSNNGSHFADNIFKYLSLIDNCWILFKFIQLKCVSNGPIWNESTLVQIMAWLRIGNKPLSEPKAGIAYWRLLAYIFYIGHSALYKGNTNQINQHPKLCIYLCMTNFSAHSNWLFLVFATNRGLVTSEMDNHWLSWWFVTCSEPNHPSTKPIFL